jgi:hypothetical protein
LGIERVFGLSWQSYYIDVLWGYLCGIGAAPLRASEWLSTAEVIKDGKHSVLNMCL